jgi:hypothetical protein
MYHRVEFKRYDGIRRFARGVQVLVWAIAAGWCALIALATGMVGAALDAERGMPLPDLLAALVYGASTVAIAGVAHVVLEVLCAVLDIAREAQSLPAIAKSVRMNFQLPQILHPSTFEPRHIRSEGMPGTPSMQPGRGLEPSFRLP